MRWNDIQILRAIHELENGESGYLTSAFRLMERIRPSVPADINRDAELFANELVLAQEAGYLDFRHDTFPGQVTDRASNPHHWLQQVSDIRLTLNGRDRALGRLVRIDPPDPDEDDGRNVASLTLQAAAVAIGRRYSDMQIMRFVRDSGVPDGYLRGLDSSSPSDFMYSLFERLHEEGSASRRVLRDVLGKWLSNKLPNWPDSGTRQQILIELAQQGWHVRQERLVVGSSVAAPMEQPVEGTIVASIVRTDIVSSTQLRKRLGEPAWTELRDRHYDELRQLLEDYSGFEINDLGDGLLVWFMSPHSAFTFGRKVLDVSRRDQLPLRVAIDTGECRRRDPAQMLEGLPLARVERLLKRTQPNEIVLSDSTWPLLAPHKVTVGSRDIELEDFGAMTVSVLPGPHSQSGVLETAREHDASEGPEAGADSVGSDIDPQQLLYERARKAVGDAERKRFSWCRLSDDEHQTLATAAIISAQRPAVRFDYPVDDKNGILRFATGLDGLGISRSDLGELERIAKAHRELVDEVRNWTVWGRLNPGPV